MNENYSPYDFDMRYPAGNGRRGKRSHAQRSRSIRRLVMGIGYRTRTYRISNQNERPGTKQNIHQHKHQVRNKEQKTKRNMFYDIEGTMLREIEDIKGTTHERDLAFSLPLEAARLPPAFSTSLEDRRTIKGPWVREELQDNKRRWWGLERRGSVACW